VVVYVGIAEKERECSSAGWVCQAAAVVAVTG
jgi:hypothetical protein